MSQNLKLFLISFFSVILFCLAINIFQSSLEDFLVVKKLEKQPLVYFIANISHNYQQFPQPQLSAKSAISIKVNEKGQTEIIFKKNETEKMEIASLTKLMTAVIAVEFYQPELKIQISKEAISQPENFVGLKPGEILSAEELLYVMLLASSNDAAFALTEPLKNPEAFIHLMNLKAKRLGMGKSLFSNATGLDGEETEFSNFSTAIDLAKLTKYILTKPLILKIISQKEYSFSSYVLHNTNQLLDEIPGIIGGKTGFTDKAGECLIVILKNNKKEGYILNVILNSQDRFEDMKKLIFYAEHKCN